MVHATMHTSWSVLKRAGAGATTWARGVKYNFQQKAFRPVYGPRGLSISSSLTKQNQVGAWCGQDHWRKRELGKTLQLLDPARADPHTSFDS
eukprot:76978-Pelagomonas_calceolata.AAC.1